ncbi:MAG: magnesium transporter CorA family protein [Desulfobulbaceae bacterium]|nr:magnesium transporter CorA family protein [Desulfobulbaceae bacterium]
MNLRVFLLNESKHLEPSSQTTFFKSFQDGKSYYWIDVEDPDPASLKNFLERLGLHSLILEEYLEPAGTPRVDLYHQSLFIKFSVQLAWDTLEQPFFSIICIPQAVITIHEKPSSTIENIANEYSSAARFHSSTTTAIIYQIFDRLIDKDMAFVLETRRNIESLEEAMDKAADLAQIDRILMLKQRISRLSIICEDQRYCVATLQTIESDLFDISDLREYFRDSLANLEYAIRSAGRQEAHLSELRQYYQITLQEKTNKRLRLLTILSAVFMPLSLITGIYGMNFRYMPELTWPYSYPLVISIMVAVAAVFLWIFNRKGWFK